MQLVSLSPDKHEFFEQDRETMKRLFLFAIVLGLNIALAAPVDAQQRSNSSRRSQANRAASATSASQDAAETASTEGADAARVPSGVPTPPVAPSTPGIPGAPGVPRAPRMGGFVLMGLQNSARQNASDRDGKVKTSEFLAEFMKAAKAADADNDGKLSAEELSLILFCRYVLPCGYHWEGRFFSSMESSGIDFKVSSSGDRRYSQNCRLLSGFDMTVGTLV